MTSAIGSFLASPAGAGLAALAAVALLSWQAERLRRSRLERFGDSLVLPRPVSWARRAGAGAAFAVACASAAALVALHTSRADSAGGGCALSIDLLVGGGDGGEDQATAGDAIAAIVRLLRPGTCVALYRAGDAPEPVAPPTLDRDAIIRIAATTLAPAAPSAERLRRSVDALSTGRPPGRRWIVLVSASSEEIASVHAPNPEILAVPYGAAAPEDGISAEALSQLEARLETLERKQEPETRAPAADPKQLLAALALAALAAESLLQRGRQA